jgi:hypothetical protein
VTPAQKIAELEARIERLEQCKHVWKLNPNGLPTVYFNGCNAYIQCEKCGQKKRT